MFKTKPLKYNGNAKLCTWGTWWLPRHMQTNLRIVYDNLE
jgi:hypothetical protein